MPHIALLFAHRKQGMTPAAFKTHYESSHVPLIKSLAGPAFPQSHKRFYIRRDNVSTGTDNTAYPAQVLVGTQASFEYDAVTEMVFTDKTAFGTFMEVMSRPENVAKLRADEEHFLDREKMKVVAVDEVTETKCS